MVCPVQTAEGPDKTGVGFEVTETDAVEEQPPALVAVTVYIPAASAEADGIVGF